MIEEKKVSINLSELQKRSIFLAVPMYGGMCHGTFAKSVADLHVLCTRFGIKLENFYMFNESLIQRGRNFCADAFMRSECTHMLFVDADIAFNAQDVITMLAMAGDDSPYDVLCGPYAKKCITWEKIKFAVDKGFADNDPNVLEEFVGDYVFNPAPGITPNTAAMNEPFEVMESGTGFMMIKRRAFEMFKEKFPEQAFRPDHVRSKEFDGSREVMAYFDTPICPTSKRYLSEDYYFCQKVREAGGKVWLCPWIKLQHTGTYTFGVGGLQAMANLGFTPTADPRNVPKK